ncbi:CDP-diacylglycerol--serine O-phosphatidyltransferase [Undibacterium oligocarboniphilum]|uniref:CDP-diacylglycerol--serine O-phosphatidyltransferase n=1 Tax=Undibacterium oligocarboniphilum TaxID=666702 RepID=A0A850QGE8_9BURK|nr:CDP-diacylglycerol--serine O-phosphatidyltransferase [Undibacterium oligocarboniphilum]MBC3870548.1 CDP-diacylglycerol--serine O-phosphatidyltransferase [Undibacterium oligocarboniphilum]NVO78651.1 CDP-diacylglycerol--serine O-phosphatidyltransferase [Undibacterium oligocarboniphilum]
MRLIRHLSPLEQIPGIPLQAEQVRTLLSAAEYRQALMNAIAQARHRIYLCSLYLQNDEAGAQVMAALYAAKARRPAIDIVVLVDWHRAQRGLIGEARVPGKVAGNAAWYQELSRLQAEQIPVYGVPVQTRELFGVLHLKGFVIDDTVIYSGASINNVYLHQQDKYRHDRYLLIDNAMLATTMVNFIRRHLLSASAVHRLDKPDISPTGNLRHEIREFRAQLKKARYQFDAGYSESQSGLSVTPLVGVGKNNPLNRVICQLFAVSRHQITICTPYFNFPLAVTREINRALKRGVRVDIIVGDKTANDFFIDPAQPFKVISALPYLYEMNLRRFVKVHQADIVREQLGVHLWCEGENTYHLKGIWADQRYALMTGNNLNPRAFRLDLENALLIRDPALELQQQWSAELSSIRQHTKTILHYREIQEIGDYPEQVRRLLARLSTIRLDRLAYRVL